MEQAQIAFYELAGVYSKYFDVRLDIDLAEIERDVLTFDYMNNKQKELELKYLKRCSQIFKELKMD